MARTKWAVAIEDPQRRAVDVEMFHTYTRCVRRAFLCGEDPLTGENFDRRNAWLEERVRS